MRRTVAWPPTQVNPWDAHCGCVTAAAPDKLGARHLFMLPGISAGGPMSILTVGAAALYATLSLAITASQPGDTLQLSPGLYVEDFPDITHSLTIEAMGGMAQLRTPNPLPPNGRAILNVQGGANADLTVINLDISGAANGAGHYNGAGILFESGNGALSVSHSWIHDNQEGILTGTTGAITITNSEIDHNGGVGTPGYGLDHNIYVGAAASLTITGSYIHDALGGHEIKSRAAVTTITDNRIQDGPTAETSYSIDVPNGGVVTITGNTIEKGAAAPNSSAIHFGGENPPSLPGSSLLVQNNVMITDRAAGGRAVLNQSTDANGHAYPITVTGNALYGFGTLGADPPVDTVSSNTLAPRSGAPMLDSSSPFAVPEPDSALLLAVGLLGLGWAGYRPRNTGRRLARNAARPSL
jgi:hypothetical protein